MDYFVSMKLKIIMVIISLSVYELKPIALISLKYLQVLQYSGL